jgi:hypothetical protein
VKKEKKIMLDASLPRSISFFFKKKKKKKVREKKKKRLAGKMEATKVMKNGGQKLL